MASFLLDRKEMRVVVRFEFHNQRSVKGVCERVAGGMAQ